MGRVLLLAYMVFYLLVISACENHQQFQPILTGERLYDMGEKLVKSATNVMTTTINRLQRKGEDALSKPTTIATAVSSGNEIDNISNEKDIKDDKNGDTQMDPLEVFPFHQAFDQLCVLAKKTLRDELTKYIKNGGNPIELSKKLPEAINNLVNNINTRYPSLVKNVLDMTGTNIIDLYDQPIDGINDTNIEDDKNDCAQNDEDDNKNIKCDSKATKSDSAPQYETRKDDQSDKRYNPNNDSNYKQNESPINGDYGQNYLYPQSQVFPQTFPMYPKTMQVVEDTLPKPTFDWQQNSFNDEGPTADYVLFRKNEDFKPWPLSSHFTQDPSNYQALDEDHPQIMEPYYYDGNVNKIPNFRDDAILALSHRTKFPLTALSDNMLNDKITPSDTRNSNYGKLHMDNWPLNGLDLTNLQLWDLLKISLDRLETTGKKDCNKNY